MAISRNKTNPVIQELLQTQDQFHKAMQHLVKVYKAVLPSLSASDQTQLNKFLGNYAKLQTNPFQDFKRDVSLEEQVRQVDDIFRGQVRRMEPAYEACARHYNDFLQFLNEKGLKEFENDGTGKRFNAQSEIIKPTQNLMRYKILIESAMKPSNLGYQGRDEAYRNDPSFQQLANLASMLDGDVKMINRRAQATAELKSASAHGLFKAQDKHKTEEPDIAPKNTSPKSRGSR